VEGGGGHLIPVSVAAFVRMGKGKRKPRKTSVRIDHGLAKFRKDTVWIHVGISERTCSV